MNILVVIPFSVAIRKNLASIDWIRKMCKCFEVNWERPLSSRGLKYAD